MVASIKEVAVIVAVIVVVVVVVVFVVAVVVAVVVKVVVVVSIKERLLRLEQHIEDWLSSLLVL